MGERADVPASPAMTTASPAPPPGRREQAKAANRAAILDAARAVFGELGYGAASVRDIVRRTELSVGAFYNHFRSKEEVYAALAEDGARRFRPRLAALRESAPDFETYVRQAVPAFFRFLVEEEEAWAVRGDPTQPRPPTVRADTPEMRAVFEEVRAEIAKAALLGDAAHGDAAEADYLAGALIALVREVGDRMLERRPVDAEGAARFAVTLVLHGVSGLAGRARP